MSYDNLLKREPVWHIRKLPPDGKHSQKIRLFNKDEDLGPISIACLDNMVDDMFHHLDYWNKRWLIDSLRKSLDSLDKKLEALPKPNIPLGGCNE